MFKTLSTGYKTLKFQQLYQIIPYKIILIYGIIYIETTNINGRWLPLIISFLDLRKGVKLMYITIDTLFNILSYTLSIISCGIAIGIWISKKNNHQITATK